MSVKLIDGKQIAADVRQEVAERAKALAERTGRRPGLATVLVGEDPASQTYVRMKHKACEEAGIESFRGNKDIFEWGPMKTLDVNHLINRGKRLFDAYFPFANAIINHSGNKMLELYKCL